MIAAVPVLAAGMALASSMAPLDGGDAFAYDPLSRLLEARIVAPAYSGPGEAHGEVGPEVREVRFDSALSSVITDGGTVKQVVANEGKAAIGGLRITIGGQSCTLLSLTREYLTMNLMPTPLIRHNARCNNCGDKFTVQTFSDLEYGRRA